MEEKNSKEEINIKNYILVLVFAIFLASIDIFLKYLLKNTHFFITKNFGIVYVINKGSAFGIFSNFYYYNKFMIVLSLLILYFAIKYRGKIGFILQVLLLAGISSNFYDRLIFHSVRDYILTPFFTFNLADFYLTICGLIIVYNFVKKGTILE